MVRNRTRMDYCWADYLTWAVMGFVALCYIVHISACIKAGAIGFLFMGILVAPLGFIHGLGLICGWW